MIEDLLSIVSVDTSLLRRFFKEIYLHFVNVELNFEVKVNFGQCRFKVETQRTKVILTSNRTDSVGKFVKCP